MNDLNISNASGNRIPGDDAITNADEQKEIVNEPNYKTDREEERSEEVIVKPNKPKDKEDDVEEKKKEDSAK